MWARPLQKTHRAPERLPPSRCTLPQGHACYPRVHGDRKVRAVKIAGWGRYPVVEGTELLSEDLEASTRHARLSRGLGRAYGDSALPPRPGETLAGTRLADRLLAFDDSTGVLRAEAGLSLARLQDLFLPRLWSSPVAPGTESVTQRGPPDRK